MAAMTMQYFVSQGVTVNVLSKRGLNSMLVHYER